VRVQGLPGQPVLNRRARMDLDHLDIKLMSIIQQNFPVVKKPYAKLAEMTGTTEDDVIVRIDRLIKNNTVRRLGAVFDYRRLGYKGTLCAVKTIPGREKKVAALINGIPGVTHNYLRRHEYNMWFTLIARDDREIDKILCQIKNCSYVADLINLPAEKLFKIKVDFDFTERQNAE